jgi:transposase
MIQLTPHMKVYVAISPVDFRNGIRGLKKICKDILRKGPDSGTLFVFRNRKKNSIKILCYDGQGFWLMMKRLSRGKFPWWPEGLGAGMDLDQRKLQLIVNASLEAEFGDDWKKII